MGQDVLQENGYVEHALLEEEALERRTYQEVIAAKAAENNVLCVLPTGMGKTAVAMLTAAHTLQDDPDTKVLVMAPTKPLADQHRKAFQHAFTHAEDAFITLTGSTPPDKRAEKWKTHQFFFCTPQIVQNDIIRNAVDLGAFDLVVFDEAHRATGEYAYVYIAQQYKKTRGRVLALTASPGSSKSKIQTVADTLGIDSFEIRTEDDPDIKPYIQEKNMHWIEVELPRNFTRVQTRLNEALRQRLKTLKDDGHLSTLDVNRKDLLKLRGRLGAEVSKNKDPKLFSALSIVSAAIKLQHAIGLLETQGVTPLYKYVQRIKKGSSKADQRLANDETVRDAVTVAKWMVENGKEHPKVEKLEELLSEKMRNGEKAIVFTQYRDTVDLLVDRLHAFNPVKFIGQNDGYTQKKQLEVVEAFRNDEYKVLVSTSIGEEGLDIPAVDYAVFYEPIPSEIRFIQRKGRVGRQTKGDIYVLMAKNTRDEAYYWSSKHKEKRMKQAMKDLQANHTPQAKAQHTLDRFSNKQNGEKPVIYVDDREMKIAKKLSELDVDIRTKRLEVADFLVSDRCAVERKTASDFVSSIIDNRLFEQVLALNNQFTHPILLIEGTDLYSHRNIHPNAVRGAVAAVMLDTQTPIYFTKDLEDTAETLAALAKREQIKKERSVAIRGTKTGKNMRELQEYVVAGLPDVNTTLSERLLEHFDTPRNVFTADPGELKQVEGVGDVRADAITKLLTTSYTEPENREEGGG